ncbi:L-lactate dehydrogenase complex protein LldE [Brevibacterium luteolum]|nr:L-lactate dehydrogenase complex protein LldE [Brevibacterium luteolum]
MTSATRPSPPGPVQSAQAPTPGQTAASAQPATSAQTALRIAIFPTCIVDAMYPRVAEAMVRILERLGHEVVFPPQQTCCSQMHVNSGYFADAYDIVRNHVEAFSDYDYDVAVAPSASCVVSLQHQQPDIARRAGDPACASAAEAIAGRTFELSKLLIDVLGITDAATQLDSYFPHRVTFHSSCHGLRHMKLGTRQSDLLRTVAGIDYAELPGLEDCCGFGGTFSFKNAGTSGAMTADKVAAIQSTGASICAGGDVSCLMNIGGAAQKQKTGITTVHFAEILASTRENPLQVSGDVAVSGGGRSCA